MRSVYVFASDVFTWSSVSQEAHKTLNVATSNFLRL